MLYAFLALGVNLGVAHYREVSGELIGEAGIEVVRRMGESPFGLRDAESWLLFFLGLLFSAIAFYEGRIFDDVYPGYGRRDRSMREARDKYLNELDEATEELNYVRENSLEEIKRIAHDARNQPGRRRRIFANCRSWIAELERYGAHLQQLGETLIDEYREANRIARPDQMVPAAHKAPWKLEIPKIDHRYPADPKTLTSSDDWLQQVNKEYRSATNQIRERCKAWKDYLTATFGSPSAEPSGRPTVVTVNSGGNTRSVAS